MDYIVYNPLARGGKKNKILKKALKLEAKRKKQGSQTMVISILDIDDYNGFFSNLHDDDRVYICGGDGTINRLVQDVDFSLSRARVFMHKAGTGNDFARDHKGHTFEITNELRYIPRFVCNGKEYHFLNGLGIGIDAQVCELVNLNNKRESYFKTAVRALKMFKTYTAELIIDGTKKTFNDVFCFVCMNGKYMGGGMKMAPYAKRDDDYLDVYVITAKSFRQILRVFPLVFFGLHSGFKKNVTYFRCKSLVAKPLGFNKMQFDGEVLSDIFELEVFSS